VKRGGIISTQGGHNTQGYSRNNRSRKKDKAIILFVIKKGTLGKTAGSSSGRERRPNREKDEKVEEKGIEKTVAWKKWGDEIMT